MSGSPSSAFAQGTGSVMVRAGQGAELLSEDGAFTLYVPEGALMEDTTLTVESILPDSLGSEAEGVEALAAYELGPSGTQFAKPVLAVVALERSQVRPHSPRENDALAMYHLSSTEGLSVAG